MQRGPFSAGLQGPWGRSRCGIDTSSLGNRFYAPPEGIWQYQLDNQWHLISHTYHSIIFHIGEQGWLHIGCICGAVWSQICFHTPNPINISISKSIFLNSCFCFLHVSEAGSPAADATSDSGPDHPPPAPRQSAQCSAVRGGPAGKRSHPGRREMETD